MNAGRYTLTEDPAGTVTVTLTPDVLTPAAAPPIDITNQLPTNEDARWPFPIWDRQPSTIHHITIHHSAGSTH